MKLKGLITVFIAGLMLIFLKFMDGELNRIEIPKDGSPPILFATQTRDDLQRSYIAAIREAKKSILVMIYSITDKPVIEALRKKSEEGVEVTLICHEDISYEIEKKIGNKVKILKRFGVGLMHLKIMVIDDSKCFIGSANLTNASLKMHGNLVTAFESHEISAYIKAKALTMGKFRNEQQFKNKHFLVSGGLIEVWFLPDDTEASIRIKHLIRAAKKTIRVAMFTFTREDFAKELIAASIKGVNVEVAMDNLSSKGASSKVFDLLNKSNISLKVNKGPGLLHYKFLYIDDNILVNGSANWTRNAFNANDDCFIVIHDLNNTEKKQMENLWEAIIRDSI